MGWKPYGQGVKRTVPVSGAPPPRSPLEYAITHLELKLQWNGRRRVFEFTASPVAVKPGTTIYSSAWGVEWLYFPSDGAKRFSDKKLGALLPQVAASIEQRQGETWQAVEKVLAKHGLTWLNEEPAAAAA
jgi:hypothetical protein